MRAAVAANPLYPRILFVYQGTVEDGQTFFSRSWPEASALADLPKRLYSAFGLDKAKWMQIFGPSVMACSLRAASKGHIAGAPVGDPWEMPGLFLVQGDQILWRHDFAHIGDHPDWKQLPTRFAEVAGAKIFPVVSG